MADSKLIYLTNRGSSIFKRALQFYGGREYEQGDQNIDLLYFDEYGGKRPPAGVGVGLSLMDRQRTIPLDNKLTMAKTLMEAGFEGPRVFFDVASVPNESGAIWFIKDPMATGGRGIRVVEYDDLEVHFTAGSIIQEMVKNIALIEGRKFTLRAYSLVHRGRVYVYMDGIIVLHGVEYDAASLNPEVQFDHGGYMDARSQIKMSRFSDYEYYQMALEQLQLEVNKIFSPFREKLLDGDDSSYCLFGLDFLIQNDHKTVLIEINDRPNIVHTDMINQTVNVEMIKAMCAVLFEEGYQKVRKLDKEFLEVLEFPGQE